MRQNESLAQIRAHQNRKKKPNFWHSTAGFPQRVASNMKKSQKTLSFWRFWAIFAHFCSLEKTAVWGKTNRQHNFSRHFRAHQKRKKPSVFDTWPSFSLRGVHRAHQNSQKTPSFWHSTAGFPQRVAPKIEKSQKPLSFWHSTRTFPERGCTGHVFRDYWVALK